MAFQGKWKRTKIEGGEAFFKAFDAPEDKLKRAQAAELTTEVVACPPDGFKMTRTYTNGSESKSFTHEIKVGAPCEIEGPLGKKHTFNISKDGDKFVAKAADIGIEMTFAIEGGQMVETWTGKGNTFKRFHAKA